MKSLRNLSTTKLISRECCSWVRSAKPMEQPQNIMIFTQTRPHKLFGHGSSPLPVFTWSLPLTSKKFSLSVKLCRVLPVWSSHCKNWLIKSPRPSRWVILLPLARHTRDTLSWCRSAKRPLPSSRQRPWKSICAFRKRKKKRDKLSLRDRRGKMKSLPKKLSAS